MIRGLAPAAVLVLVAAALWVRLAPTDAARWHSDPLQGAAGLNSHVAKAFVALPPADALSALDTVALATPRTLRLAGSADEGRITWITRSALWAFPDFTTASAVPDGQGASLVIHARSRFGVSDMGVNAARVNGWLARLAP
jgi:uncharacterized protein (DUF1499 family)